jgi:Na+/H+ antiporter NhaD/arsenite permease-like protein
MVAQGVTSSGGAEWIVGKVLGTPTDTMLAQIRMCLIASVFSSFVNDTPVFCIMLPIVLSWAAKARLNIRQLIIPLSYCCLLGGLNTVIGTSTNLVVSGQFSDRVLDPDSEYYQEGKSAINMFGITPFGALAITIQLVLLN